DIRDHNALINIEIDFTMYIQERIWDLLGDYEHLIYFLFLFSKKGDINNADQGLPRNHILLDKVFLFLDSFEIFLHPVCCFAFAHRATFSRQKNSRQHIFSHVSGCTNSEYYLSLS
ncbi:hypothetical protein ACJX0J_017213, partial [Zea mays]